jgi:mercuric ion transport protein
MNIELIFDRECPNVEAARAILKAALARAGLPSKWKEWERTAARTPPRLQGFGSPTVLIDGVDVTGEPPAGSACCRVYRAADGRVIGAPSAEIVGQALRSAAGVTRR